MQEMVYIIIPLLVGLVLIFVGLGFRQKNKRLIESGIKVEGVIYEWSPTSGSDYDSKYPVIRFVTKEGVWITEKADVGLPIFVLKMNKQVTVYYNPANPKEFIYKTSLGLESIAYLLVIVGVVVLLAGLGAAFNYLIN